MPCKPDFDPLHPPAHDPLGVPSAWVRRFAHLIPAGGTVLDLAAGAGRHSRFLADRKHPMVAVDRQLDGMADLAADPRIELVQADLETGAEWPLPWPPERRFAGIVVTNYLHRPLLPRLPELLAPGGAVIYETFAEGQERHGRPSHPDFLLRPGELIEAFRTRLTIVAYEHGLVFTPREAVIQRIAAVKGEGLRPL